MGSIILLILLFVVGIIVGVLLGSSIKKGKIKPIPTPAPTPEIKNRENDFIRKELSKVKNIRDFFEVCQLVQAKKEQEEGQLPRD